MTHTRTDNSERGQASLIGLLVVAVLGVFLVWFFVMRPHPARPGEKGLEDLSKTTMGQAIQEGHAVDCQNNLSQIRQAMQMWHTSEDRNPTTLSALSADGVTPSILFCPVSHRPYSYDPRTGRVWCTTPGHERF